MDFNCLVAVISFLWLVSPDSSADEIQSQNAALVQMLNNCMPKFHSHVICDKTLLICLDIYMVNVIFEKNIILKT